MKESQVFIILMAIYLSPNLTKEFRTLMAFVSLIAAIFFAVLEVMK